METTPKAASSTSLHPLLWIAGISVTLLSLAGIASLTGILPVRQTLTPEPPAVVAAPPVTQPPPTPPMVAAVAPPLPVATPAVPALPASKTPPVVRPKAAKKQVEQDLAVRPPPPLAGVPPDYVPPAVARAAPPTALPCTDCGVIANVRQVTREGQGSGAGAVVGGLAGGALANNIGRGDGRTLATILGMVGGGLLGNSIEKSQRQTVGYQVDVRMDDGTTRHIDADSMPAWRIGDKVKLVDGAIVSR